MCISIDAKPLNIIHLCDLIMSAFNPEQRQNLFQKYL
jgi:hypothetical protein